MNTLPVKKIRIYADPVHNAPVSYRRPVRAGVRSNPRERVATDNRLTTNEAIDRLFAYYGDLLEVATR